MKSTHGLLQRDQNWQCTCEQNQIMKSWWIGADDENAVKDFFDECLCQILLSSAGKIKKEKDCRVVANKSKKKITTAEKRGHFVNLTCMYYCTYIHRTEMKTSRLAFLHNMQ